MSSIPKDTQSTRRQDDLDDTYILPDSYKNTQKTNEIRTQKIPESFSNPLFQIEMKFDSLKNYVDSVTSAVNQHAALINKVKTELTSRINQQNLSEAIQKFANSITIKDLGDNFMITALNENTAPKDDENVLKDSVNKFCNKLEILGDNFSKLNKMSITLNGKMQDVETSISKKVGTTDLKAKMKKTKAKLRGELENNSRRFDVKVQELEKKYLEKVQVLEKKICQMEGNKKGADRKEINEDELLKKDDLARGIKNIEEKLLKEMDKLAAKSDGSEKEMKEFNKKIGTMEEGLNKQMSNLKQELLAITNSISKKTDVPKYEDFEKEILKKMQKEVKTFSEGFESSIAQLTKNFENLKQMKVGNEGSTINSQHELNSITEKINTIQQVLKGKVDFDELHAQLKSKTDRSEFLNIVDIVQGGDEKYKKLHKIVEESQQKIDKVNQNFDRKVAKLKKEFDLESLLKQFKSKADEENVQKSFETMDSKINGLTDGMAIIKKELEKTFENTNKPSNPGVKNLDNAFISIKSILPKACLSCGSTTGQQTNHPPIKKAEKAVLKESTDRPFTALSNKTRLFMGATIAASNTTNFHPFRTNSFNIGSRLDSAK